MPLTPKVQRITVADLEVKLSQLYREHTKVLSKIASDPRRYGNHLRSGTHGRAIFDQICRTYQLQVDAIDDALAKALRLQLHEPIAVGELVEAFRAFFEPERSRVLEHSRARLSEIRDGTFINETVLEANRLISTFAGRSEHIIADHKSLALARGERPASAQDVTGAGATQLASSTCAAYGRSDPPDEMQKAAEILRELERLRPVLKTLSEDELSAYSTGSLPIATFLHAKGHAFSVLPEPMLAEQFRQELERRKHHQREGWPAWYRSPSILLGLFAIVLTILGFAKCSSGP